jgi:hypothetical protein
MRCLLDVRCLRVDKRRHTPLGAGQLSSGPSNLVLKLAVGGRTEPDPSQFLLGSSEGGFCFCDRGLEFVERKSHRVYTLVLIASS